MKYLVWCFLALFLFTVNSSAQVKSAVGTLVSSNGGSGSGTVCLKIGRKTQCFEWAVSSTKFSGFDYPEGNLVKLRKLNKDAWEEGAQWRITYSPKDMFLRSATFSGRVIRKKT